MKNIFDVFSNLFQKLSVIITDIKSLETIRIKYSCLYYKNKDDLEDKDAGKKTIINGDKVIDLNFYRNLKRERNIECCEKQLCWSEILTDEEEEDEILKALDKYFIYNSENLKEL